MIDKPKSQRAIDLYAGIGGWSLGLKMAGIDVVASYEWWAPANQTNQKNNRHDTTEIDIRTLPLHSLPSDIDFVVGSPPCTQFSYANRGGSGDIEDGLKDIEKFLEVVDHVKPKFWAMENVPRVSKILARELSPTGRFKRFMHLNAQIDVVDMCEWGVPQKRKRSIVGNFDFQLLHGYRSFAQERSLGTVIDALNRNQVIDPIYGLELNAAELVDHIIEAPLSPEEARMNREMKTFHPVYNGMAFPDLIEKPSRTITATCTRVSRESIVVPLAGNKNLFRRLTVRERACIQGFPITYQFFGSSFQQKLKMIGNAVPPAFTYYVAHAMRETSVDELPNISLAVTKFTPTAERPILTPPDTEGSTFPNNRRFRSAIPNLRLKSGVRFEFSNSFEEGKVLWSVRFFFGHSKAVTEVPLDLDLQLRLTVSPELGDLTSRTSQSLSKFEPIAGLDHLTLQRIWSKQTSGHHGPFDITDCLGQVTLETISEIEEMDFDCVTVLEQLLDQYLYHSGMDKLRRNAAIIVAGLLVGTLANAMLTGRSVEVSGKQRVA